ncbi:MAG: type 4a pilus biogenesis protein PilO [Acidobacteriia bacterium]|nr:type 4a pilus biogenesis protein PilO [Terriglobia bacterium]
MPRSFDIAGSLKWKDPRVAMRAIIGTLLVANLSAAVIAFKPFGGSAEDLRRQQHALGGQLQQLQARLAASKSLVEKVRTARSQGDQFVARYFLDGSAASSSIISEIYQTAATAGVKLLGTSYQPDEIEGSDTMEMLSINAGVEGSYANLTKFVNLLDKSPRFLIIESMQAAAPQQGPGAGAQQNLNVVLKIDTFVNDQAGVAP